MNAPDFTRTLFLNRQLGAVLTLRRTSRKLMPSSETLRFLVKLKINATCFTDSTTVQQTKTAPSSSPCTGL